jgi:hypothetical protein
MPRLAGPAEQPPLAGRHFVKIRRHRIKLPERVLVDVVEQLRLPVISVGVIFVFRTSGSCMSLAARASRRTRGSSRCLASVLGALF